MGRHILICQTIGAVDGKFFARRKPPKSQERAQMKDVIVVVVSLQRVAIDIIGPFLQTHVVIGTFFVIAD